MSIELYSTCPAADRCDASTYVEQVTTVARWSERARCEGILIYSDNRQADPWLVAQLIMQSTERLVPLVAVQPVYMHPYAVAIKILTLSSWYRRPVYLNLVAGGFRNDLLALDDNTLHDARYDRLVEYASIIRALFTSTRPVTVEGQYYSVHRLKLNQALPEACWPRLFISGSSEAGIEAARKLGATAVQYPQPAEDAAFPPTELTTGIRVGIIAREQAAHAWTVAQQRFPYDRRGQIKHGMAMKTTDSKWHEQLSATVAGEGVYWLHPFKNYQTMCPYLVGDYDRVSVELRKYMSQGHRAFILDVPGGFEELVHARRSFMCTGAL